MIFTNRILKSGIILLQSYPDGPAFAITKRHVLQIRSCHGLNFQTRKSVFTGGYSFVVPFDEQKGLLTDIGVEELGHLEMVGAIVHQLTRNLKDSQIQDSAFAPYFVDHTTGVYPTAASGAPWSAFSMQVKGDPIADLSEDLAAEAAL